MAKKMDFKARIVDTSAAEKQSLANRFMNADRILSQHPHGLPLTGDVAVGQHDVSESESQVVSIPLALIDDNPYNARHIYDSEKIQSMAASIAKEGQKYPAPVVPNEKYPGRFILIDGHYRKHANLAANKSEMKCMVHSPLSDLELYRVSFILNHQRNEQTAMDNAISWQKLLDQGVISKQDELMTITGLSWGKISKTLSLLKLSPEIRELIREHAAKIGATVGYELVLFEKARGIEETTNLVKRIVEEDLSSREVEELRKRAEKGNTRKPKETSRQYKITGEVQSGVIKEWESGKVTLEVNVQDPVQREKVLNSIKQIFGME